MLQRLFNFTGLLMLLYIWHHINDWSISINTTNIISSYFVKIIHKIPFLLINIFFIILILIYIYSIITTHLQNLLYWLTIVLSTTAMTLSLNILCLNETTNISRFMGYIFITPSGNNKSKRVHINNRNLYLNNTTNHNNFIFINTK